MIRRSNASMPSMISNANCNHGPLPSGLVESKTHGETGVRTECVTMTGRIELRVLVLRASVAVNFISHQPLVPHPMIQIQPVLLSSDPFAYR